jgi:hypothetical protein
MLLQRVHRDDNIYTVVQISKFQIIWQQAEQNQAKMAIKEFYSKLLYRKAIISHKKFFHAAI